MSPELGQANTSAQIPGLDGYVSVDIEASGPVPGRYAMLSLGACLVADPAKTFYAEFQPASLEVDPEAMAVHGLVMDTLQRDGLPMARGMAEFDQWLAAACPPPIRPVLGSTNAPFDWMFVHDAFVRALGRDPLATPPSTSAPSTSDGQP